MRGRRSALALSAWDQARLWLSYQRYALLLFALSGSIAGAMALWAPARVLWWLFAAPPALGAACFGVSVFSRWPRKARATAVALRRIATGRFAPHQVRGYCGDPCFRVVAREILARAGYSRTARRHIVRDFARELRAPISLLVVDHADASVLVEGTRVGGLTPPTTTHGG